MARPIKPIPTFRGKAARWLTDYLENTRPDPAKQQRAREHIEAAKRIRPPRK